MGSKRQELTLFVYRSFATLGLFIMLIQIAIDPLTQQLIKFRLDEKPVAGLNATIGVSQTWYEVTSQESGGSVDSPLGNPKCFVIARACCHLLTLERLQRCFEPSQERSPGGH